MCSHALWRGLVNSVMKGTLICAMLFGVRKRGKKRSPTGREANIISRFCSGDVVKDQHRCDGTVLC